ncbi:MAG: class I SAM-dependent methyltransferase [Azospirillaceae bacterium]
MANLIRTARHLIPLTRHPYRGEAVDCPACGGGERRAVASLDRGWKRLPTAMCATCGLLYTNPMPTDAELARFYREDYRFTYQGAIGKPWSRHVRKREREAVGRAVQMASLLAPGARVLDFGCGSGEFVSAMLARDFDAHGFEPGETYGSSAETRLGRRITVAGWSDVAYEAPFDLITAFQVIEHLRDPLQALRAMLGWLAPAGRLYLEVPNLAERPCKGIGWFHFAHVLGFNHWNLRLAAARVGLRPVSVIAPTQIVFERGEDPEAAELAAKGLALARADFLYTSPMRRYWQYRWGKLRGRRHAVSG